MFSHTSRPRSRIWGTSVRKHCFFFCFFGSFPCFLVFLWFLLVFQWFWVFFVGFYWFFNGFLWFYNGFESFFIVVICFPLDFVMFLVLLLWFFVILLVLVLVPQRNPKENYSKTNPSRLRDLSGASFWACPSSVSACSGAPSPGLPLSLSLSSGLLWAPLAGSGPLLAREYSLGRSGSALGFLISQ